MGGVIKSMMPSLDVSVDKKKGKGLCPFHNDTNPSFFVDRNRGIWKCFGCGANGNLQHFMRKWNVLNNASVKKVGNSRILQLAANYYNSSFYVMTLPANDPCDYITTHTAEQFYPHVAKAIPHKQWHKQQVIHDSTELESCMKQIAPLLTTKQNVQNVTSILQQQYPTQQGIYEDLLQLVFPKSHFQDFSFSKQDYKWLQDDNPGIDVDFTF